MKHSYPMEFVLDDGTRVVVDKTGTHHYTFALTPQNGAVEHFTVNDDEEFTEEKEKLLSFDQLNALRLFWLKTRDDRE